MTDAQEVEATVEERPDDSDPGEEITICGARRGQFICCRVPGHAELTTAWHAAPNGEIFNAYWRDSTTGVRIRRRPDVPTP